MITMKQIADAAGVSRSTVSFILNDSYRPGVNIPENTRERVKAVAMQLGYRRNEMAVAMITGQTKVIGFCAYGLKSEYISRTLAGTIAQAQKQGYFVKIFPSYEDTAKTLDKIIGQRPAGIIAWSPSEELLDGLRKCHKNYNIPIVMTGSIAPCKWAQGITSDDAEGSRLAVEHLLGLGHRKFLHVSINTELPFAKLRLKGFKQALRDAGIPCGKKIIVEAKTEKILTKELATRLSSNSKPTAICCDTDITAMQTLRALDSIGYKVPEDISVVGFADLSMAQYANPALTTIEQPFEKMGQAAVKILTNSIENKNRQSPDIINKEIQKKIQVKLIKRKSTSRIKDA